jgi:hypothetical protein
MGLSRARRCTELAAATYILYIVRAYLEARHQHAPVRYSLLLRILDCMRCTVQTHRLACHSVLSAPVV